jgi:hypothetical protein
MTNLEFFILGLTCVMTFCLWVSVIIHPKPLKSSFYLVEWELKGLKNRTVLPFELTDFQTTNLWKVSSKIADTVPGIDRNSINIESIIKL